MNPDLLKYSVKEIKLLDKSALLLLLSEVKRELFVLRFQKTLGELKNTARIKLVRRAGARISSEISLRRL
jgi:large subunit ribosomal protein L29